MIFLFFTKARIIINIVKLKIVYIYIYKIIIIYCQNKIKVIFIISIINYYSIYILLRIILKILFC